MIDFNSRNASLDLIDTLVRVGKLAAAAARRCMRVCLAFRGETLVRGGAKSPIR